MLSSVFTSTSMISGQTIIGDDIAYLRKIKGQVRCVNTEKGIFGIIRDVNGKDDPVIYANLMKSQEVIFSNVLTGSDNNPYWINMGIDSPKEGENHSGPGYNKLLSCTF